jgi:uncharacterized UPF0160 family protein
MIITAMKQALEALEESREHIFKHRRLEAITSLRQAIAEAEKQEPVAWVVYSSAENDIVWAEKGKRLKQNTPLYAFPPKREWVGLTDEEIWNVLQFRGYNTDTIEIAKAIEAKLKEKNT